MQIVWRQRALRFLSFGFLILFVSAGAWIVDKSIAVALSMFGIFMILLSIIFTLISITRAKRQDIIKESRLPILTEEEIKP